MANGTQRRSDSRQYSLDGTGQPTSLPEASSGFTPGLVWGGDSLALETAPTLSEQMVRRDNYFHSCWVMLKQQRPDLWEVMTRIELSVAGVDPAPKKEETDESDHDLEIL